MRKLQYILMIMVAVGCGSKTPVSPEISADEYAVINLVLKKTVMPVETVRDQILFMYRNLPKFPPPGVKWTGQDVKYQKMRFDSVQAVLDTAKFYISIQLNLEHPPAQEIANLRQIDSYGLIRNGYDQIVKVKRLVLSVDTGGIPASLEKERVLPIAGYQSNFYGKDKTTKGRLLGPGKFVLSRVAFDKSKTLAFIYVQNYCGRLCGGGTFYLLEKVNGSWRVFEEHSTWVA